MACWTRAAFALVPIGHRVVKRTRLNIAFTHFYNDESEVGVVGDNMNSQLYPPLFGDFTRAYSQTLDCFRLLIYLC